MTPGDEKISDLQLFIFGKSGKSETAIRNLQHICRTYLGDSCLIEVIDLSERPEMGNQEQILAIPTLIIRHPAPGHRIIGDLSETAKVLALLGVKPAS